jgi:Dyp-type peroxidase family
VTASAPTTVAATPESGRRRAIREPLLAVDEIQGNVLAGFNKDHQLLIALAIRDVASARRWVRRISGAINSTAEVLRFNALFRMLRARLGSDPPGLVATWANVAFSHGGIAKLSSPAVADQVPDAAFREGLPARVGLLDDPAPEAGADPTSSWVVGATDRVPDILLIVASDDPSKLCAVADRLRPGPSDGEEAPAVIWEELGETRPDHPGHEHFGFKDGVSQPGVRGLVSRRPRMFLTPRLLKPPPPGEPEISRPGQPLVWPGQFVFGYPSTDGSGNTDGGPVPPPKGMPRWIRNGSLLVFRRLHQNVAAFTVFVRSEAASIAASALPGMSPERLGAMLVGRWASGAPLSRAPSTDQAAMATDPLSNNDFLFTVNTPPPVFRRGVPGPPVAFPAAVADSRGVICPRAAHVRKLNPRDQHTDLGDQFDTLTRRVLRRGIPYGTPLADPTVDDGADRGLHFLCYQTSIESQFEILQQTWANRRENPTRGGHDLIIGQTENQVRDLELLAPDGTSAHTVQAPQQWVVPTGGGYFFAPSISALRDVFGDPGART